MSPSMLLKPMIAQLQDVLEKLCDGEVIVLDLDKYELSIKRVEHDRLQIALGEKPEILRPTIVYKM